MTTISYAKRHRKPWLHLSQCANRSPATAAGQLRRFLDQHKNRTLNVAGSRSTKEPGIEDWVRSVLLQALPR